MIPKDGRCEEHGMYLYRTGFGWSCKLGCYYTDDPQKIKDGFIAQYKEELKGKINKLKNFQIIERVSHDIDNGVGTITYTNVIKKEEVLKLLESEDK